MLIQSSRLISLIKPLSPKEKKDLLLFANSPIHNQNSKISELLQLLLLNKQKITSDEILYARLFPGSTYSSQKLRHLFSYSIQCVTDYLCFIETKKSPGLQNIMMLRSYRRLNRHPDFIKQYELECENLEQQPIDTNLFLTAYYLHIEQYEEYISKRRTGQVDFDNITLSMDAFYLCSKLKLACNSLTHKNLFHANKSYTLDENTLQMLQEERFLKIPLLKMLFAGYLTMTDSENEIHFKNLKESLVSESEKISHAELKDMYTIAINFCIKKLNTGRLKYLNEVLDLYKVGLVKDIFLDEEKLSPFTYKNITSAALRLGELDWALHFIHQYKERLPALQREEFHSFCLGKYYTVRNEYDQVVDCLHNIEFSDLFTNLDAKVMLIKAYYELSSYSLVDSLLDNFRLLMQRKEVLSYHKINYSNFIKATRYLLKVNPIDKQEISETKQKIHAFEILTERDWLLRKLELLT